MRQQIFNVASHNVANVCQNISVSRKSLGNQWFHRNEKFLVRRIGIWHGKITISRRAISFDAHGLEHAETIEMIFTIVGNLYSYVCTN